VDNTSGHDLVNPNANKCLDITGNTSVDLTPVQIWTCTGGANQKWTVPAGDSTPTPSGSATPPPTGTTPPGGGLGSMVSAPYTYLGWGNPPDLPSVMSATGIKWFTMAFVLAANNSCDPKWDSNRPLTGGADQTAINKVRAAGGDVMPSFGGANGSKLELICSSASALAGAYQKVINAYGLKAIDIDIETDAYANDAAKQRTVDALKIIKANDPGIAVFVTFPSNQGGPDSSMISKAAAAGLAVDGWSIMTFDWGGAGQNMATLTTQAADGLKNRLKSAYGYTDDQAYRHTGISSMNGITDDNETVTVANFQTIETYAAAHHLARLTFWSSNRDRPCGGGYGNDDTCSGVSQQAWDFTRINAQYQG
jgi:hypothetical protein